MLTANERLNQPVYFHGNRIGRINDFWLDLSLQHIMGITVRRGWAGFSQSWTIAYADIFGWQKRSLSTGSANEFDDTTQLISFRSLRQQRVIIDGQRHGHITDILFDADGKVSGICAARFGRFGSYIFTPDSIEMAGSHSTPLIVNTTHHFLTI